MGLFSSASIDILFKEELNWNHCSMSDQTEMPIRGYGS